MESLAQVIMAMAVGAMPPVTALLVIEIGRLRRSVGGVKPEEVMPPIPGRVVDDDVFGRIEAMAQLVADAFDGQDQAVDPGLGGRAVEIRSKRHLTLLRLQRAVTAPPGRKRSSQGDGPRTRPETYPGTPRQTSPMVTRD